jgi:Zn-dependent protease
MDSNIIFQIVILIFSVIIHEVSHGAMALAFGDKTAQYEGRLTLNPLKHIDWFGSVVLPLLLYISHAGFMIGWAKPVPYNPYNLKNAKIGEPVVAFAGPMSNIIVAVFFGILMRIIISMNLGLVNLVTIFGYVVIINISLAIFNLVPIPPLDGSKILFSLFPNNRFAFSEAWSRYGILIIILFLTFISSIISPIIFWLFKLITGLN